jgi:hypothetical protein
MAGKSPVMAGDEQRGALAALAGSRDRGEADRARAVLLTLGACPSNANFESLAQYMVLQGHNVYTTNGRLT